MSNPSHATRFAATLAATGLVSLGVLTVPSFAVADTDRSSVANGGTRHGRIGVLNTDDQPRHRAPPNDLPRWSPDEITPPAMGYQKELYPPRSPKPDASSLRPRPSTSDGSPEYTQIVLAWLAGAIIAAAAAGTVGRRRRQQPLLETALAAAGPDEMSRAAGLLGDRFVCQSHAGAAEHAYRAAIDIGHEYWSPIAQIALAQLFSNRGDRTQAQALLEAAIAAGHPRAATAAQARLGELRNGNSHNQADGRPRPEVYETLG